VRNGSGLVNYRLKDILIKLGVDELACVGCGGGGKT